MLFMNVPVQDNKEYSDLDLVLWISIYEEWLSLNKSEHCQIKQIWDREFTNNFKG